VSLAIPCRCGALITAPDHLAGWRGRCPSCEASLQAPAPPPVEDIPRFRLVRVDCGCGRRVTAPLRRLRAGLARCPRCDRALAPG